LSSAEFDQNSIEGEERSPLQFHSLIFERTINQCREFGPIPVAVASPLSEVALTGAIDAARAGLATPYFVGPSARIKSLAREKRLDIGPYPIVDVADDLEAAERAVFLCRVGTCKALMKGSLPTDQFLKRVVDASTGLRLKRRVSHAVIVDAAGYPRPLIITDSAINMYPKLEEKADIVQNAIKLAQVLGIATPKVAILSAIESVSSRFPSTIDASALCKMADRGQITGGILDGPLAFDDAVEPEAVRIKQIQSAVAGQADILVVPDLEAGHLIAQQLQSRDDAETAGVAIGAQVPIILTGRAANPKSWLASTAVAALLAHQQSQEPQQVIPGYGVLLQEDKASCEITTTGGSESLTGCMC
jgi:phosphate acetyltransferase